MKLGLIGLGAMGVPMAGNLLRGGHELFVWARRTEAARALTGKGARLCASPKEVAASADVIFTIVTTGTDVEEVVLGKDGVIHGAKAGSVLIDCSTIPPAIARNVPRSWQVGASRCSMPRSRAAKPGHRRARCRS